MRDHEYTFRIDGNGKVDGHPVSESVIPRRGLYPSLIHFDIDPQNGEDPRRLWREVRRMPTNLKKSFSATIRSAPLTTITAKCQFLKSPILDLPWISTGTTATTRKYQRREQLSASSLLTVRVQGTNVAFEN